MNWRDIIAHRELFMMFAWRDLKVRYKQTGLGVAWAVLQPFLTMVVFSLVFGRIAGMGSYVGGLPYPIFTFSALLPWTYFSTTLTRAGNVLVDSSALVTKVYFPRLVLPLSTAISGLVDLAISLVVLVGMMFFYGIHPTWALLTLPLFVALTAGCAMGAGLWLSALNVEYRDVKFIIPFLVQIWMYLCPVIYPLSRVPARFQTWYSLNPMVGAIAGFRWSVVGGAFPGFAVALSVIIMVPMMISGLFFFRRMERIFADVV